MDKLCKEKLGLRPLPPNITVGVQGAQGFLSIVAPGVIQQGEEWAVSSFVTAHRLLLIVALTKALIAVQGKCNNKVVLNFLFFLCRVGGG